MMTSQGGSKENRQLYLRSFEVVAMGLGVLPF